MCYKNNNTPWKSIAIFILSFIILFTCTTSNSFAQDNTPPTIINGINDQIINEDQHFRLELKLNEVFSDESPLSFSIDKKNADWLANVGDSVLVGFPLQEHIGDYEIEVKAIDSAGNFSTTSFTISVLFVDDKPIVLKNLPGQLQRPGFGEIKVSYKGTFYEEEDESLSYDVRSSYNAVAKAELIGDSILITEKGIGPAEIILTATDSNGNKAETKMFLRIYEEAEILNMNTSNTGSNGLLNSLVTCVKNDLSGNIWVGHYNGISRYKDGKWEQFQFEYEEVHVREIWDDGKGSVLFLTVESILKYNNQEFTFLDINQEDGPPQSIRGSYIANDNSLFIAGYTDREFNKFIITRNSGDKWETIYSEDRGSDLPYSELFNMCIDNKTNIWLATNSDLFLIENGIRSNFSAKNNIQGQIFDIDVDIFGQIWFISYDNIFKYDIKQDTIKSFIGYGSRCIFADNIGNIWTGTGSGRVVNIREDKLHLIEMKDLILKDYTSTNNYINHISKTNDGRYWFCSRMGLYISENYLIEDESTILQHTFDGLPSNEIRDIQRDHNGVYWFNTNAGLSAFNGSKWDFQGGLRVERIDNNGRKLCAYGSIFTIIDEQNNKIDYKDVITGFGNIYDIEYDKNKNIWISISGLEEYGLVKFDGTNWTKYGIDDGLLCNSIGELFADSKGNLWMDYNLSYADTGPVKGISKFDGSTFTHYFESNEWATYVNDFLEDKNGNIWMATLDGLFKYDGENWTNYNIQNGLESKGIESLALDYAGGIWISYSGWQHKFGVSRFDGIKFDHFTTEDGLPTNNIKKVYVDHALTNQNKSTSLNEDDVKELIWLGSGDKGAANFYLQNATSVVDRNLPEMEAMIFPNPTAGITNIILDNQKREYLNIEVLTIDGKKVYQNNTSNLQSKVQVNLSTHPPGTYFIRLKSDIDSVVKKVILN